GYALTTPQQVTVTVQSGEEYVYMQGAADLPDGDQRTEVINTNLVFGNTLLSSDLSITKTDGLTCVSSGQVVTYTIVVSNSGPATATDALVSDTFPSTLTNVSWTSVAAGGASGNDLSGMGNINDYVTLAPGSTITYTVTGTVASSGAVSTLSNFGMGVDNTNLGQAITVNGVTAEAFYLNGGYQTTNTVLWGRNVPNDHGIGVWSSGEPDPVASGGDVNEISNQLNNEVLRLTKADGQSWTSLWVSSLDSGGSGSAEAGTLYWSNSATPDLSSLSTKFTFHYGDFGTSVEGDLLTLNPANFDPSAKYLFFVAGPNPAGTNNDYLFWKATTTEEASLINTATVTVPSGFIDSNSNNNSATDTDCISNIGIDIEKYVQGHYLVDCKDGGEGLTPGFWKTHSECGPAPLSGWPDSGYKQDGSDSYETIFGVSVPGTPTLLDALGAGGGGLDALMRHSTAALLNATNPFIDYLYTKAQVISMVQDACATGNYETAKNLFATQNELGADLCKPDDSTSTCWVDTPMYDADLPTDPQPTIPVGGQAIFTYVVKNTGDVALSNIQVTDDKIANLTFVGGDTDNDQMLDTTETWTYKATETVLSSAQWKNIGTVTGTADGQVVTDSDAAHYNTPALSQSIGDRVWEDSNANGVQDAGESGIAGVTVKLLDSSSNVLQTMVTDANGNYLFDVAPGTYKVAIVAPAGYAVSPKDQGGNDNTDSDIDPNTLTTAPVTIVAGQQNLSVDAGLTAAHVCFDYNFAGNTSSDGSDGNTRSYTVNGVTVNASAWSRASGTTWGKAWLGSYSGGLGVTDSSESGAGNTHTIDNYGRQNFVVFQFSQNVVVDKAYLGYVYNDSDMQVWIGSSAMPITTMSNSVLTSMGFTEFNSGGSSTRWADLNAGEVQGNVLIVAAKPGDTNDYFKLEKLSVCTTTGEPPAPAKASIGNLVWEDKNANGVQDAGEAGIAGVTVKLLDAGGAVLSTMTTDANGNYLFSNLTAGDYKVQVVTPTGYSASPKDAGGNDSTDSDIDPSTGQTIVTTLIAGENDMTWDAGFYKPAVTLPASIGNLVWEDKNANGVQDAGETGIGGVTVKLLNGSGTLLASTTTDANGNYLFSNLAAGDYKVQVIAPTGYSVSPKDAGGDDAADSDIDPSTGQTIVTTLVAGENDMTWDAGLYKKPSGGTICDRVWYDSDKDGIQDKGESGVGGIKVCLQNSSGKTIKTCVTDSNGNYNFDNVDAGSYRLWFDKSGTSYSSKSWSTKDVSSNKYDTTDSDVNSSGYTSFFSVKGGDNQSQWDAGITPIVIDLNGDGIQTISRENALGSFDLLGNGNPIQSGWLSGNDGFLAVDRNGNGRIDDISELFGGNAKGAGFAMLASYDSNGDGVVNAGDARFADLRIWQDANGNHQTDAGELMTLAQAGVSSLNASYDELPFMDANGNLHLERSSATLADGTSVDMTDVYFNVSASDAAAAGVTLPSMADLLSGSRSLDGLLGGSTSPATPASSAGNSGMDFDTSVLDAMKQLAHLYDQAVVHA
ncbi:partial Serine-aspartate repeat-containing protein D, partial [Rhodocyclaceae bacterium]